MFRNTFSNDLQVIFKRDPAARTKFEVILTYPGLHALWCHRIAHKLWKYGLKFLARWIAYLSRFYTGIEIHPAATIGSGLFIDHGMGIVIGETAEIGNNVTLYQGVTLGGVSWDKGKRHPTIEDDVVIGAGAKVLGPITIGKNTRIGANAVVLKDTPSHSIVVGVPGQIIVRSKLKRETVRESEMPDAVGVALTSILKRLESLESSQPKPKPFPEVHPPEQGIWHGEDFSI